MSREESSDIQTQEKGKPESFLAQIWSLALAPELSRTFILILPAPVQPDAFWSWFVLTAQGGCVNLLHLNSPAEPSAAARRTALRPSRWGRRSLSPASSHGSARAAVYAVESGGTLLRGSGLVESSFEREAELRHRRRGEAGLSFIPTGLGSHRRRGSKEGGRKSHSPSAFPRSLYLTRYLVWPVCDIEQKTTKKKQQIPQNEATSVTFPSYARSLFRSHMCR